MSQQHALIIGGGLGGLAVALRLAATGRKVTLCEKGPAVGGKMNRWRQDGFVFDTGPSLITMPWIFEELFEAAGARLSEHLELMPLHPYADYVYPDGTRFKHSAALPEWLKTVRNLEARDAAGFYRFLEVGARLFELSSATFFRRRPFDPPDLETLRAMRRFPIRYGWGNYHNTVAAHFRSPYLQQLYDRYTTYVGSSPYRTPATLAVIPYIEYAFGGWYVQGGLYRIIETLEMLARQAGIEILCNACVERIEHDHRRIRAAHLSDGTRLAADIVVMNGDASYTPTLLGESRVQPLPEPERSMSGLVFLIGLRRPLPEMNHHTVYFSEDYGLEFTQLFDERRFPDDPTVYVNIPGRTDRSVAPPDGEALFIMANAPANDTPWDDEQIETARRAVFARLSSSGFPEIENDIVVSDVWSPDRFARRYQMPGGAIYGVHSHGWRRAFLRAPNKDRRYAGLYYVGGSTHPGGGTPTVLLSTRITCELIQRYDSTP